jgi:hypothetical protein
MVFARLRLAARNLQLAARAAAWRLLMNIRTTALLALAVLGLGAFLYFYEIRGEGARHEAEEHAKRLFSGIEPDDVSWIALRTSDGADARFEQSDGKWRIVAPIAFPADAGVGRLAEALATATSEKSIEHPQPDAEYGLDDGAAKIVRFGAGGAEHVLRIGKSTPIGSNVYARADDSPTVHMIASYRATAFARSLGDLRDKQILSFDPSAIAQVEAHWPGGRVALERAPAAAEPPKPAAPAGEAPAPPESDWRMTAPLAVRGDADAVDNLLSTLSFLRADAFIDAPTPAQRKQLEPPDFEVRLGRREPNQPPLALAIGKPEGERRLVSAGGDVLYQIAATRISDFPRTTVAYRERHLARFPATDAQQLDFFFHVRGGDPVAIHAERGADSGWTSSPESFGAGKLAGVVAELSRLRAADIVAESMDEKGLEKLGLSPPHTIITVLGAAPKNPAKAPEAAIAKDASKEGGEEPLAPAAPRLTELHLGNVTPQGVVAQAVGDPIVYRLDLETAERLPVDHDAFQSRFREQPAAAQPAAPGPVPGVEPPETGPATEPAPGEDSP